MKPEILCEFIKKSGRPLSFREIADYFNLKASERKKLKKTLKELILQGRIIRNRKGLYLPVREASLVTGFFEAHRDGYGFVIPDNPGEPDIFIPPHATMSAMNGDRVVARVEQKRRREGRIIRILERAVKHIVGTVERAGPVFYIKPRGRNITEKLITASTGIKIKEGDLVFAEVEYMRGGKLPLAKVQKIFEKPKNPLEDIEILIYEYELPKKFPQNVSNFAKKLLDKDISKKQFKGRVDLRELPTVTIDGENAKDFDDAVSIKKTGNGFVLWVHIADVSHYLEWNSPLDIEARKRATSVYLPHRVIPMLPAELSENLCSLLPKTPRLTFTVEMHFSSSGQRKQTLFYPSVIQTAERMTYTSVKKILDRDSEEIKRYSALVPHFENMAELCEILKSRRRQRGSLDFDLPEPEVLLDIKGDPKAILKAERNLAHFIIEEFMIAANSAVAEFLYSKGLPTLYRVHEKPEASKINYISKIIRNLGILHEVKPETFPELIELIRGTPYEETVNYLILRSLKQARYSPENVGHFGLALDCYTHFTSPIRRYPDIVVHRILKEFLRKGKISNQKKVGEILPAIAIHSSRMERKADDVERDAIEIMRVWFMKDKIGEEFEGRVTMVTPDGLRVRLDEYYIEGFMPISNMIDDFYQFDEKRHCLIGLKRKRKFTIGTPLRIRVSKVSIEERQIIFDLL